MKVLVYYIVYIMNLKPIWEGVNLIQMMDTEMINRAMTFFLLFVI